MILPLGIGLVHALHEHEDNTCRAINESHFHSEKTDCNNLHYFSQTLGDFTLAYQSWTPVQIFGQPTSMIDFKLIKPTLRVMSDRGPPIINTF